MKKILVVGVGGIGSWLASEMYRLIFNDQIKIDETEITVVDDDTVELKNIKYQNFDKTDIAKPKAQVIGSRYTFAYETKRIETDKDLEPYDIILICVDNAKARALVYDYCIKKGKFFIDGRAEGKSIALFTKNNQKLEELKKTLGTEKGSTSCQLQYRLQHGMIDLGNKIIADIMAQCLLNHLRGESNPKEFRATF